MKKYEVQVGAEAEEFCLAFSDKWGKVGGHAITIDMYQFSAVPVKNIFRISEVTSGAKFFDMPVPEVIQSYEATLLYLETVVAAKLIQIINKVNEKNPNQLNNEIERLRKKSIELLGEKPQTEKLDTEWLKADISDVLN